MGIRINRRRLGIILAGAVAVFSTGAAITVADSTGPNAASIPAVSAEQSAIAAWADANGLTGLSPAGLTVAPVRSDHESEIRAWASANGLSGLSPASLSRVDD